MTAQSGISVEVKDRLAPRPITEALANTIGRTVFKVAAALWVNGYRWHMPAKYRFIIHDAPKKEPK